MALTPGDQLLRSVRQLKWMATVNLALTFVVFVMVVLIGR
jgi:low affinity Fe/Cu permease